MTKKIYIYNGPGVSSNGIQHLVATLNKCLDPNCHSFELISDTELLKGFWVKDASLFIMPGGADLPYIDRLNGQGNAIIRNYVENGGTYLGICAGAYYASKSIVFAKETDIEVIGSRELSFFSGISEGAVFSSQYYYDSHKSAKAAIIKWFENSYSFEIPLYYNGGGYFVDALQYPTVLILGAYKDSPLKPVAIIECCVGKGRTILSHVHFEYDPALLDKDDPYLKDIIPPLYSYETQRLYLTKKILNRLGLKSVFL